MGMQMCVQTIYKTFKQTGGAQSQLHRLQCHSCLGVQRLTLMLPPTSPLRELSLAGTPP